ncbi:MAG: helix-turn-helix domain-containing protein [Deltaproteobacteria bacterium]|nr:helix-turn-helix domain-containing protein [Deltaproteobacteria bacterium]
MFTDSKPWHGHYTDAPRLRTLQEIQNSTESIAAPARRFGVSERTVRKWKNREFVADLKCSRRGVKQPIVHLYKSR